MVSHHGVSKKKRGVDPGIRVGRLAEHSVDKQAIEGVSFILKRIDMVLDIRVSYLRNFVDAYSHQGHACLRGRAGTRDTQSRCTQQRHDRRSLQCCTALDRRTSKTLSLETAVKAAHWKRTGV